MNDLEIFEQWRTVSGFPNYQVSNVGRVMNIKTGKVLKLKSNITTGYVSLKLSNQGILHDVYIHRLIAEAFLPVPDDPSIRCVDHIDRNRSNNALSNLRWVSHSYNQANRTKSLHKSSQYKGVRWRKDRNKWCAKITKDGIEHNLGYFENEIEAARAYNNKALELFGEHALSNDV